MFRWLIKTGIRCIKRGIPSFKPGTFQGTREVCNAHNLSLAVVKHRQVLYGNYFRKFFFRYWLQNMTSRARLRCSPLQRIVVNQRNLPTSTFLAFVGFAFVGSTGQDLESRHCAKKEQLLHNWLQNALKTTSAVVPEKSLSHEGKKLKDYEIKERLGKPSSNSAVYAAEIDSNQFALKMLYNYSASSQSHSLYKAFLKELTILSSSKKNTKESSQNISLPRHYNIINPVSHFTDDVPLLSDAKTSYPAALPPRLCENGFGRNRTLFLVMPRFTGTLSEYISQRQGNIPPRTSLALLTQLLEGLVHLSNNKVAHRDLKNDNLLVNETSDGLPHLVITDFGCCLAEKRIGLIMPYETDETSKGGNVRLMAPEVACAKPGRGHKIDYTKADEWAAGALAYEMFGEKNPFEDHEIGKKTYKNRDLPELKNAPRPIKRLIKQLLCRHPNDRPSVSFAATICQLLMWAPGFKEKHEPQDDLAEVVNKWFRKATFELTLEMLQYKSKDEIPVEKQILCTFLCRTSVNEIMEALEWLNSSEK